MQETREENGVTRRWTRATQQFNQVARYLLLVNETDPLSFHQLFGTELLPRATATDRQDDLEPSQVSITQPRFQCNQPVAPTADWIVVDQTGIEVEEATSTRFNTEHHGQWEELKHLFFCTTCFRFLTNHPRYTVEEIDQYYCPYTFHGYTLSEAASNRYR